MSNKMTIKPSPIDMARAQETSKKVLDPVKLLQGSPINFKFVGTAFAKRGITKLYKFEPEFRKQEPSWEGREQDITTHGLKIPLVDSSEWGYEYAVSYVRLDFIDEEKRSDNGLFMQDVTISVSQNKNIVKTILTGMDGTVKEYINKGDYAITMNVGLVAIDEEGNITDEYPEAGIEELYEYISEPAPLKVGSPFLGFFGIDRIVITDYSIQCAGDSNRQEITINAISDMPYIIQHEKI